MAVGVQICNRQMKGYQQHKLRVILCSSDMSPSMQLLRVKIFLKLSNVVYSQASTVPWC